MKKILSMLVVVSIVALSAMGAFAADYLPDDNGRYTVEVTGLQAGEMYGMVAIKGTQASQITEANIVYIDQATADADGKISFTSFGTMGAAPDDEDFVEATVFVGGAGYTSATAVGTLKAAKVEEPPVDEKVVVSGKITDASYVNPVVVTAKNSDGETIATAETDGEGNYSFEVEKNAAFDLTFSKQYYCTFTYTGITATDAVSIPTVDMAKYAGDVNETFEVNAYDLGELLADFNKTVAAGTLTKGDPSDINSTDEVNAYDLGILLAAFNAKNTSNPYTE